MSVLLDTNVLGRLAQSTSPQHLVAKSAVDSLQRRGENLCIVPQVVYEFGSFARAPSERRTMGLD